MIVLCLDRLRSSKLNKAKKGQYEACISLLYFIGLKRESSMQFLCKILQPTLLFNNMTIPSYLLAISRETEPLKSLSLSLSPSGDRDREGEIDSV